VSRLRQDLAYALRAFAKAPGFALVAVLVLGMGIGANTAVFTIVNELLLRPLSGRAGELMGVYSRDTTVPDSYRAFSYPNYVDIRARGDVFDALMAHTFTLVGTPAGDSTRRTLAAVVSSNYFDTLGVRLAAGRPFTPDEERPGSRAPVVIVSYARWKQAGFDPAFVGQTVRVNAIDLTVVGVAPEGFTGTLALISPELYLPLGLFDAVVGDRFKNNGRGLGDRANAGLGIAGRLTPGMTDEVLTARLAALSAQLAADFPDVNRNQSLSTLRLSRLSGSPQPQDNTAVATLSALLLGLSGTVLVIACLNVANMLLARGAVRQKELAVRLALGANRGRVIRQLLTESVLLAIAGGAVGLLLSAWAARALSATVTAALPFGVTIHAGPDRLVLLATMAFVGVSTLAFGLGPALRLSRRDLVNDLNDRSSAGAGGGRLRARHGMVVAQVALSLALLTAGGIFARTALGAANGDPGFAYDGLLVAGVDTRLAGLDAAGSRAAYISVLRDVRALPGVAAASVASTLPFSESVETQRFEALDGTARAPVRARGYRTIGADHFASLGLSMARGREFTRAEEESASAPRVAIVDEAFARELFGSAGAIGQMIRAASNPTDPASARGEPLEIVGIAPPLREELLDRAPVPHVYVPFGRHARADMHVTVRLAPGASAAATLDAIRGAIRSADPRLPVLTLSTMRAFHDRNADLWALKAGAWLFAVLGALALVLAVVGVYGVKAYVVSQRTREIGLRMALGATSEQVLGAMLREGGRHIALGLAIGVPLAVLVSVAMNAVFVEIGGVDVTVIAIAAVLLAATGLLAAGIPARRAARVNPLVALRAD
jgi:predicted permease